MVMGLDLDLDLDSFTALVSTQYHYRDEGIFKRVFINYGRSLSSLL